MKSLIITEPHKTEFINMKMPVIGEGEALLKLKYVGFCGSDVSVYKGTQPFASYPRIPGHEFSAEIVDIAKNSLGFKKGMTVTAVPYFNCGDCYSCRKGLVNCCMDNRTMGVQRDGAFCEYVVVPISKLVDGTGVAADVLSLVEPFCISYHAVKKADIKKGEKVLVIGAGAIGTFAALAAKQMGAEVTISDVLDKRLELAMDLGVDFAVNTKDLQSFSEKYTNGNGYDVCVEAVGINSTFLSAIDNACFGARLVLIGNGSAETTFNHSILLKKELRVFGSRNALISDFNDVVAMIKAGRLNLDKIITHVFSFEKGEEAFNLLINNDGSASKVLLKLN